MIKSIWEIGEDGTGLGELYCLDELCYQEVINSLSKRESEIFGDLCYDGWIFVLENNGSTSNWDEIVALSEGRDQKVTFEFLLNRIKEIIKEELAYKGEV